jgi:large subunit ribosomal protein L21
MPIHEVDHNKKNHQNKGNIFSKKTCNHTSFLMKFAPRPFGLNHLIIMGYAVIKTGGKQYRVQQGDKIDVEKLALDVGSETTFDVLLIGEGSSLTIGKPTVNGASVTARVIEQHRGEKGVAFKFKRRKGFHKKIGFRRHLTKLEITAITA